MSQMFAGLVYEQAGTTGTGDFTLAGAVSVRFRTFNAAFGTGSANTFRYVIHHTTAAEWEIGQGYLSSASVLVRQAVIESSNGNALVSFSSGTKDVFCAASPVDVGGFRVHNVMHYGAKGDSHYANGGGTDDTLAIQRAEDAAGASGGFAVVYWPAGRTFRITAASGTDAAASDSVLITGQNASDITGSESGSGDAGTTGEARVFGGKVPTTRKYPAGNNQRRIAQLVWGKGALSSTEIISSFYYARHGYLISRGFGYHVEKVADLDANAREGAKAYVDDSNSTTIGATVAAGSTNKVEVGFNGTNWKILSVWN